MFQKSFEVLMTTGLLDKRGHEGKVALWILLWWCVQVAVVDLVDLGGDGWHF